jgi:outer membrane protein
MARRFPGMLSLAAFCAALLPAQTPLMQLPPNSILTRQQAEQIALANNPRIQIGELRAKVQHEAVREARSYQLPNANGDLTGVEANQASRISVGSLGAPRLLQHVGVGVDVSQLITDFGRTKNLVASAKLTEQARHADAEASREDITLSTDQVFFQALEAQATLAVAAQTVAARQTLVDQVSALTAAKLKSELDLSFAQVSLSQAKLLQLDARNDFDSAKAALSAVLGFEKPVDFQLADEVGNLPPLQPDVDALVQAALRDRPDLQSLRFTEQAAQRFSRAQRDRFFPTISALAVVGSTPVGSSLYFTPNWYGAAGINLSVPLFNGFRYSAQAAQASIQIQVETERERELRDVVVRDVRAAWLNANTAFQRVSVAGELLKQSNTALDLAQTRYKLGLSSIVELSQAQLQQTQAAIADANARAAYGLAIASLKFQTGENR